MEVSVSEITTWQLCHYKWALQYRRRLQPRERNVLMASGSALHESVEAILKGEASLENRNEVAEQRLFAQFPNDPYADEKMTKYLPGVIRGLSRIPAEIWEMGDWHVEELFTYHTYTDDGDLSVRMKPDLYREGDDVVTIYEIKTTDHDPVDYLLTSPQHEWYGLGLDQKYEGRKLISFIYLCIPVGERAKVPPPQMPYMFSRRRMGESLEELRLGTRGLGEDEHPNRGWWCNHCDFKAVCTARVTGGSTEDVIQTQYEERPRRIPSEPAPRRHRSGLGILEPVIVPADQNIHVVFNVAAQGVNLAEAMVEGELIQFDANVNPEDVGIHPQDVIEDAEELPF